MTILHARRAISKTTRSVSGIFVIFEASGDVRRFIMTRPSHWSYRSEQVRGGETMKKTWTRILAKNHSRRCRPGPICPSRRNDSFFFALFFGKTAPSLVVVIRREATIPSKRKDHEEINVEARDVREKHAWRRKLRDAHTDMRSVSNRAKDQNIIRLREISWPIRDRRRRLVDRSSLSPVSFRRLYLPLIRGPADAQVASQVRSTVNRASGSSDPR